MKVTVTTFKTAVKNGFDFNEMATDLRDYGWRLHRPSNQTSMTVAFDILEDDDGAVFGRENLTPVTVICKCGAYYGTAILEDENSALRYVKCPECGHSAAAYGNENVEFDDNDRNRRIQTGRAL